MARIILQGKAQAKQRAKVVNGHVYTPTETKQYEARLARAWAVKYPNQFTGDVEINIVFYMPIPISWNKQKKERARRGIIRPSVRPDIDNLIKTILDGLNGVAYMDDKQVVSIHAHKVYGEPKVEVSIDEI